MKSTRFLPLAVLALLLLSACDSDPSGPGSDDSPTTFNLTVGAVYLVQSVQTLDRSVPIVAGRDAYLRVFGRATEENQATPTLRVRLFDGQTLRRSFDVVLESGSIPTTISQSTREGNWTIRIPAEDVTVGLRIDVEIDPNDIYEESSESDNRYPAGSGPLPLDVREVQPLRLRFVPVHQVANGLSGNVSEGNIEDYLTLARKIFPLGEIDADLRAPYSVSGAAFDPEGNVWAAVVSELDAVRVAEGSGRNYYGVVRTPYAGGGVVGIAAGIPSRTALGWDRFPDAPNTFAHEIGHNFGRRHAPCGGAAGNDPEYPYPTGMIGSFGVDIVTGELKTPTEFTDIMGYCNAKWWISDYTFTHVFNHRAQVETAHDLSGSVSSLVVWGRIVDGKPILEPAFRVETRPALPSHPGPYRIEGIAEDGSRLFSFAFAGDRLDDLPGDQRIFSFAVPVDSLRLERLTALRVTDGRREFVRRHPTRPLGGRIARDGIEDIALTERGPGTLAVRWNAETHPLVLVRDPRTGEILSIGRDGDFEVSTSLDEVELIASDGIRSFRARRSLASGAVR